jgi:hypothetical protein
MKNPISPIKDYGLAGPYLEEDQQKTVAPIC